MAVGSGTTVASDRRRGDAVTTRKILIGLSAASVLTLGIAAFGGAFAQSYGMMGGNGPGYSQDDGRSADYGPGYGRMRGWGAGDGRGMMDGYGPGMMYGYGYGRGMMGW